MADSIFDIALDKRFTDSPELVLANVDGVDVLLIHNQADGKVYKIQASVLASFINAAVSQADILDALSAPYGVATLDSGGRVPSAQLPAYVDDVLEYATASAFPATGESGKIYVALDTNLTYRWGGSAYVEISPSLALGETSSTAYRGDRGKTAYDHSQTSGNPHGTSKADVGLGNVDNTSDANKPVSTAQQTALNAKVTRTSGGVTAASGVATTLFTAADYTTYELRTFLYGGNTAFMATATIISDGTGVGLFNYEHGAWVSISLSGKDVQVTQNSGAENSVRWVLTTLPN